MRWQPWALLLPPVAVIHLLPFWLWPEARWGWGDSELGRPAPIEVAFVRELAPAARPAAPPPTTRTLRPLRPAASAPPEPGLVAMGPTALAPTLPPERAASSGLPELSELPRSPMLDALPARAEPLPPLQASTSARAGATPGEQAATPGEPAVPAPAAGAAASFEWPPSTRLTFELAGQYRGPVEGQARVEWRLAGQRYQVALEVTIGPPFAPLVTRQLLSDGVITPLGLEPRRYEEETHIALRPPRRLAITLDADQVRWPSGRWVPRPPGLQDSASQFVQMTWLFTMQPERLRTGEIIEFPLALPRHVLAWAYEVAGEVTLHTPMGPLNTVHLRPRLPPRAGGGGSSGPGGGDLSAEFWVAPTLQNLPVRMLIRQDEDNWVDLTLKRLPQQAESPTR